MALAQVDRARATTTSLASALLYLERAGEEYRRVDDPWGEAECLAERGDVLAEMGQVPAARDLWQQSLKTVDPARIGFVGHSYGAIMGGALVAVDKRVKTFVDPCAIEMGRDPELMAEVSQRTGMQIVCATGFYKEEAGLPYYWRVRSAEEAAPRD